ncbi:hypothetical protein EAI_17380 [Harpegnathos saltator]|uniref:Uncharacterized protein n=1 Tax=Harpegnathos saltator TaxID=610380 RepID=E2CA77_HARSA|nr:hypothetical protein EAI_17380 [Harpegnathos saltator]
MHHQQQRHNIQRQAVAGGSRSNNHDNGHGEAPFLELVTIEYERLRTMAQMHDYMRNYDRQVRSLNSMLLPDKRLLREQDDRRCKAGFYDVRGRLVQSQDVTSTQYT